ncbi:MAG: anion permease [Chlamydiales bacterium]|nr:anion permease [Chlamydiales bacterium]
MTTPPITAAKTDFLARIPKDILRLLQIIAITLASWYFFKPEALSDNAWKLFCIFVGTIVAIIAKPLPMGAIALSSIAIICATKTLTLQTTLAGFAYDQLWLIVFSCFLARGFIKTGLGRRIAYGFVGLFGGTPYGMSYGLVVSTACMAPLIPSTTARTGGIILPVLRSIISVVGQSGNKNIAPFLTFIVMHASVITSAMFITANAGNPIVVKFAQNLGIEISWLSWAKAAIVPGVLSLALLPVVLKYFLPCKIDDAKKVQEHARSEIATMGKITWQEKTLLTVFGLMLALWSFGSFFGVHATEAALFGVSLLLVVKILSWKDILQEDLAWDTFLWMGILIMMASELQNLGVIAWFTDQVVQFVPAVNWPVQLFMLSMIYFYSHYFFASIAAHVSSMYGPFLAISITAGAPPLVSALLLGFLSSLFGALTHYSSGPAPILYSEQHTDIKTWWKIGFFTSLFYIVVWVGVGGLWWSFLDLI